MHALRKLDARDMFMFYDAIVSGSGGAEIVIRVESVDLFGERVVSEFRKTPAPKGYAANPGTGPQGETCKSCTHSIGTGRCGGRRYWKCELIRAHWTSGPGSDILLRSPACKHWQAERVDGAKGA